MIPPTTHRKQSILLYAENYLAGGTETCIFDMANFLDRERYAVELWVNRNPDFGHGIEHLAADVSFRQVAILSTLPLYHWLARRAWPRPLQVPFKLVFVLVRYLHFLTNVLLFYVRLRRTMPDILQVINGGYPGGESCQAVVLAGRLAGVQPICFYGLNTPAPPRVPMVERLVDWLLVSAADFVVFNAQAACELMSRWRHVDPARLVCIHTGSRIAVATPLEIAAARRWIDAPAGRVLIGELAMLEPRKGQHVLLQAAPSVLADHPAHLVLIGQGDTLSELKDLARTLGISEHVTFTGLCREHVNAVIAALDIMTLPSFQEGLPYAILEGMAQSRPIVATTVGGIPEQIVDGESGLLVPPGDPEALAEAIRRLVADRGLAEQLGRSARAHFECEFTLGAMLSRFYRLYEMEKDGF